MKKICLFFVVLLMTVTVIPASSECTASTTIDGYTFECKGEKTCSSKAGKWIKCDGNKIKVSVQ